jgi:hypothetical protein
MLDEFWHAVGEKLADRWAAAAAPAVTFWAAVVAAWASRRGSHGLQSVVDVLSGRTGPGQVAVVVTALGVVAASAVIMQRLTPLALRVIEGYWPSFLRPLGNLLVNRVTSRVDQASARLQALAPLVAAGEPGSADRQKREEFVRLDRRRRRVPRPELRMPTRVGNTLRAAETRPTVKYGLDTVTTWPHMWLVLPDQARGELASARAALDASVSSCLWGLLFTATFPWAGWVALAGPAVATAAYKLWVTARAEVFADLVEACYDLYRMSLYRQLRWPLPANPAEERRTGRELSTYLLRGSGDAAPAFVPDHPGDERENGGSDDDDAGRGQAAGGHQRALLDQDASRTARLPDEAPGTSG